MELVKKGELNATEQQGIMQQILDENPLPEDG
jgi:polyhydroxyalkanoate synthesis regulator phasin